IGAGASACRAVSGPAALKMPLATTRWASASPAAALRRMCSCTVTPAGRGCSASQVWSKSIFASSEAIVRLSGSGPLAHYLAANRLDQKQAFQLLPAEPGKILRVDSTGYHGKAGVMLVPHTLVS